MGMRRRTARAVAVTGVIFLLAGAAPVQAPSHHVTVTAEDLSVSLLGTSSVRALARATGAALPGEAEIDVARVPRPRLDKAAGISAVLPGIPKPLPLTTGGQALAFEGLDQTDSRLAYNANQFTEEPPDGALCAGDGAEVELVNAALQFFSTRGEILTPPLALNQFWGLPPSRDLTTNPPTFPGPFSGDVRCVYDPSSHRFMLAMWGLESDPATGDWTGRQAFYIAVQATSDPVGTYHLYKINVEPPAGRGCPCEADFPAISTDANVLAITYDKFLATGDFAGARMVVLSKRAVLRGTSPPRRLLDAGTLGGGLLYALMGATPPPGGRYQAGNGGTLWFTSMLDFVGFDNRVAVEALTNTSAIDTDPARIGWSKAVVHGSLPYGTPPKIKQKPGPRSLGEQLGEPLRKLDSGGTVAAPATLARGLVWSASNTQVGRGPSARSGALYFAVRPQYTNGVLSGSLAQQGYLAVAAPNSVVYPGIAVRADGTATVVLSLAGPEYYPSAVYAAFRLGRQPAALHLYKRGVRPDDGATCYEAIVGPGPGGVERGCRWGDYSGASVSPTGQFWLETEFITDRLRTPLANWGTAIAVR